jgi:hypothetical protein
VPTCIAHPPAAVRYLLDARSVSAIQDLAEEMIAEIVQVETGTWLCAENADHARREAPSPTPSRHGVLFNHLEANGRC